jgi:hypothetical protein
MTFENGRQGINVENVILWRESLSTMKDNHFFDLLKMYLGEIKTPYNKQNLIENLSAFLRKEENKETIIALLSKEDLELLTAIYLIPKVTQKKLNKFFSAKTYSELFEHLMNLEERLLIFRFKDKDTGKILFKINPLLEQNLKPYLTKEKIISYSIEYDQEDIVKSNGLSPEFLAGFIAFVLENPDLLRADGTFKKKVDVQLKEIFPTYQNLDFFKLILNGFINLGLFRQNDDGIFPLFDRLKNFARLTETELYVYLAVAATGRYPRDVIQKQSQHFIELLAHIEGAFYTKENIIKQSFLLAERNTLTGESTSKVGRFAAILREAQNQKTGQNQENHVLEGEFSISALIDNGLAFGLLNLCKNQKKSLEGYVVSKIPQTSSVKNLNIDGGFSVSIMPGLPLLKLLTFAKSLEIVKLDTILQMEINKKSILNSFSLEETPESLMFAFSELSNYEIPQNLKFSIEDWFENYNSANLFYGYVLKIQPEKAALIEKNPVIEPYIKITLAPGVFLLDFASNGEAQNVIENSGLDFIGKVKKLKEEVSSITFPTIKSRGQFSSINRVPSISGKTDAEILNLKERFLTSINNGDFSKEIEEELKNRVSRGIIVNPSQLKNVSIRPERTEAFGMDYLGKIRVMEHALASENFAEITYDDRLFFGQPIKLEKTTGDTLVTFILEPSKEEKQFSLGHAQKVKRIRGAIFKEQR